MRHGQDREGEIDILIERVDPDLALPTYAHPGDAGLDLVCAISVDLTPGERGVIPTGIAIALPPGFAAFVHPRSGLAARLGLSLVNAPGTIDAGYRGEIAIIAINLDPTETVHLARGDRVAQLVIQQVFRARIHEVDRLPGTHRGDGGLGSTGA